MIAATTALSLVAVVDLRAPADCVSAPALETALAKAGGLDVAEVVRVSVEPHAPTDERGGTAVSGFVGPVLALNNNGPTSGSRTGVSVAIGIDQGFALVASVEGASWVTSTTGCLRGSKSARRSRRHRRGDAPHERRGAG